MDEQKKEMFLLDISCQDDAGKYHTRVVIASASSVEEAFEDLAQAHPEWETADDYTTVGHVDGYYTNVTAYKVSLQDTRTWHVWRQRKAEERRLQIIEEQRQADLQLLRDLVKKHGMVAMEVIALAMECEDG